MAQENKTSSFLPIVFLVVFIDLVGIGIVIPLFAPLFLSANSPIDLPFQSKTIILGLLLATYPLAQFFGAPIIGAWSDHVGRKKAYLVSIAGTCIGYIVFAFAVMTINLPLMFLGRVIEGFFAGNISVAFSTIADISDQKSKAKNFGLIGMAFGFGFIIGPFIGGKLSDPSVISWFNLSTPFLFAALLCALNFVLVFLIFKETLKHSVNSKLSLFTGIRNIKKAFAMPNLSTMFTVIFLLAFGFSFFTQFFQVYLVEKFNFTQGMIGDLFAFIGICIAFTQGVIVRVVAKYFSPAKALSFSMFLVAPVFLLLLLPDTPAGIYLFIPLIPLFNGISFPNYTAIISGLADPKSQGEVMGINQSLQSIAIAVPAILAGFIAAFDVRLPIIAAFIVTLVAAILFNTKFRAEKKELFHEV